MIDIAAKRHKTYKNKIIRAYKFNILKCINIEIQAFYETIKDRGWKLLPPKSTKLWERFSAAIPGVAIFALRHSIHSSLK